ncbi:MAG: UDP-N-acetylmuramate--L-alanine ligase [Desulfobacterales bacterium]
MYRKQYHIHFVGIGGIGMSGIAELLLNLGYQVSGSDIADSDVTRRLQELGGNIFVGHSSENIKDADVVVASSAIRNDNAEIKAALAASVPVIPRAEMLAELMRLKYSVAVAGAHGKTSTTSMLAEVLGAGGLDPTVVIGGKLKSIGSNAVLGRGDFIVAEADESDGSFLKFSPTISVITNIDLEHLDFYRDLDQIKQVFLQFIDRLPFYGLAVLCLDNEHVQNLIPEIKKRYITYGLSAQADFQAAAVSFNGEKCSFSVYYKGRRMGEVTLNLPGRHNIANALAAIAVGHELEIPFGTMRRALENIAGVQRRLEVKAEIKGIKIVDDYGHHPTEIKTTLEAVQTSWPNRRLVVVFQPHRYSRTKALFDSFARSFYQSDVLVVMPVYAASEEEIQGADHHALCGAICAHGHKRAYAEQDVESALNRLEKILEKGDIVLTLGAGNVWQVGDALSARLDRAVKRK